MKAATSVADVGAADASVRPAARGWRRMRLCTSSMAPPAKGCRPDTISWRTTHSDQTSSASSAGRPARQRG